MTIGHLPESVAGADCVIRTAAVHDSNPEIAAAHAAGIPVFERAQAWGSIMRRYENALCISGTHGKTTTTSMATHIFMAAQADPTVMIGGTLPILGTGHRVGKGKTIILESCEYCNSFLSFYPTLAVILNIEADHLDFFKDLEDVEHAFRAFADLVPPGGTVLANGEDANTMKALEGFLRPEFINRVDAVITFNRLSKENFKEIAKIMLGELVTSLGDKGITFTYDDSLVEFLVEKSFSRTYGARNLRRTIQKELEDPMATKIIDSYEHPITQVKATVEDGAIRLYTL